MHPVVGEGDSSGKGVGRFWAVERKVTCPLQPPRTGCFFCVWLYAWHFPWTVSVKHLLSPECVLCLSVPILQIRKVSLRESKSFALFFSLLHRGGPAGAGVIIIHFEANLGKWDLSSTSPGISRIPDCTCHSNASVDSVSQPSICCILDSIQTSSPQRGLP